MKPKSNVINIPVMRNDSGIEPTAFNVLMKPDKVEERTKGGIILTPAHVETDKHAAIVGVLVAVSPLAFCYETWPEGARKPKPGDRVIIAKYAGSLIKGDNDEEYRLITDKDILAIKEK